MGDMDRRSFIKKGGVLATLAGFLGLGLSRDPKWAPRPLSESRPDLKKPKEKIKVGGTPVEPEVPDFQSLDAAAMATNATMWCMTTPPRRHGTVILGLDDEGHWND